MGDPLIWLISGLVIVAGLGAVVIDRWRRRRALRTWPLIVWLFLPLIAVAVPAFGCAAFVSNAAGREGACMALGGAMMALPILYWPVWLIGVGVGLVVQLIRRPAR